MRRLVPALFALATFAASPALAQAHPDFSGKWTMDASKSNMGPMPMPTSATLVVVQNDKTLKLDQTQNSAQTGEQSTSFTFNLDGSESTNTMTMQGQSIDMKSKISWDGATMVSKSTINVGGQSVDQTQRWSLSADGKTLTQQSDVNAAGQTFSFTLVFNKV